MIVIVTIDRPYLLLSCEMVYDLSRCIRSGVHLIPILLLCILSSW